jgi:hypothetical protein
MKAGRLSLLRILKLLGIIALVVLVLLYIDYTYGLRRHPKSLSKQSKTAHFYIYTDIDDVSLGN